MTRVFRVKHGRSRRWKQGRQNSPYGGQILKGQEYQCPAESGCQVSAMGVGVNEIKNETVGLQATHRKQKTISGAAVPYLSLQTAYDLLILNVCIYL